MPTFTDETNKTAAPKGEYVVEVLSRDLRVSKMGDKQHKLTVRIEGHGKCFENLTESKTAQWRIDTFLKATQVKIKKGEDYEFDADEAAVKGVRHIEVIGLRAWAKININDKGYNEIDLWVFGKPIPARKCEEQEGGF